jgi:3-hydroxyisobutyrate dehydrogenase
MPTVAVLGVGRMGLPVCARLAQAGYDVVAHDVDPTRQSAVEDLGARWAERAHVAVDSASMVLTVLPGTPELQALMRELLASLRPGSTWLDLTSTSPRVGSQLRAQAHRIECVDAPMGGGPPEAEEGSLELFVGCASDRVEAHRPLLETLGTMHHVGEPGAGQIVKLLVNLLWFGQAVATAEALLLARRSGLALDAVCAALEQSAAETRFIRRDVPRLLEGDYMTDFGLDRCYEELEAIAELARGLEVPFGLSAQVRDVYARALERYGARDGELLAVAMLEEIAGTELRAS